jgi:hypothetical protein
MITFSRRFKVKEKMVHSLHRSEEAVWEVSYALVAHAEFGLEIIAHYDIASKLGLGVGCQGSLWYIRLGDYNVEGRMFPSGDGGVISRSGTSRSWLRRRESLPCSFSGRLVRPRSGDCLLTEETPLGEGICSSMTVGWPAQHFLHIFCASSSIL